MPFHVPEFLAPRGCASSRDARWRSLALAHLTALACGAVVAAGLLAAPLASGDDPTPSAPAATPTEAPTESALPALKVFDPCFTGKLSVGNTLTAVLGPVEGEIGGVKVEYQWLRDGEAIAGATSKSYTLVEDDAGTGVSVRITASKPGYITEVRESCNRRISAKPISVMPRAVKLSGSAKVGGTLKVVGRSWGDDVKMQYRWTCDHETFKLTSKASLKLGPDQVGCRVSVAVRGYAPGKASAVRVTNHPEVVGLAMALATPQIGIASETGLVAVATVKAGTVLTATFAPDGDYPGFAVAWEWLRDGVPIPGQTGSTYAASWDDEGRTLSARGTATADGYESATGVTSGVGVQKATAPAVPPGEVHRPRG